MYVKIGRCRIIAKIDVNSECQSSSSSPLEGYGWVILVYSFFTLVNAYAGGVEFLYSFFISTGYSASVIVVYFSSMSSSSSYLSKSISLSTLFAMIYF